MEKTYSKSPCECKTPICEDCFQIEKDMRDEHCSICKEEFNENNTINEFLNPFFDPEISPRKTGLPDLEFMEEARRLKQIEIEMEQTLEKKRRQIQTLKNIAKNIFIKSPILFIFSIIFGNIIVIFKNRICCNFQINVDVFVQGLLCILFLNLLHDCIYVQCSRSRWRSSFARMYEIGDNQSD